MYRNTSPEYIQPSVAGYGPNTTYGSDPRYSNNTSGSHVTPGNYQTVTHTQTYERDDRQNMHYQRQTGPVQSHWANTAHGSQYNHHGRKSGAKGGRYDQYRRGRPDYKYNCFSVIDEPWNRCLEFGKCGTCPGNECIARRTPKQDWI